MDESRKKGLDKMNEVYAWEMPNMEGDPYFALTVDHLFGSIWTRPGLSMRDKRLMTLAVVTALGLQDLTEGLRVSRRCRTDGGHDDCCGDERCTEKKHCTHASLLDDAARLKGRSDVARPVWPVATDKSQLTARRLVITFVPR
jgi:hypothetical protein